MRSFLSRARSCSSLPLDFIEKLPASDVKIAKDAFEDTPMHDQCVARSIELERARLGYVLDETGTVVTFKEGVTEIELAEEDKKQPEVGQKCTAQFKGRGKFYPGKVAKVNSDGTIDVDFDDGDKDKDLKPASCKHRGNRKVVEVVMPESVKIIPANTFEGFSVLATIMLPQTLEEIGAKAFKE